MSHNFKLVEEKDPFHGVELVSKCEFCDLHERDLDALALAVKANPLEPATCEERQEAMKDQAYGPRVAKP